MDPSQSSIGGESPPPPEAPSKKCVLWLPDAPAPQKILLPRTFINTFINLLERVIPDQGGDTNCTPLRGRPLMIWGGAGGKFGIEFIFS